MPLSAVMDSVEDLDPAVQELYTKKGEKYELTGITGIKTVADTERLQTALTKERAEHKETKTALGVWGELKHDEVTAQLDRIPELEAAGKGNLNEEQIEEMVTRRVEGTIKSQRAPLERQIATLTAENGTLKEENQGHRTANTQRKITDAVRAAGTEAKVIAHAMDDALMHGRSIFEVREDDGAIVTKDGVGVTPGLSPKDWFLELDNGGSKPHWFGATAGSGANGSGNRSGFAGGKDNPWSADGWNKTAQGHVIRDKGMAHAEKLAQAAGTTVHGLKPVKKS